VFDVAKLSWINRHYMKEADPARLAALAVPYFERCGYVTAPTAEATSFVESLLPMAIGSVDRVEEIPERVGFVFGWKAADAARLLAQEPDGGRVAIAFADAIEGPLLDRDAFRAAAGRVRDRIGLKGKALFHPLRVIVTGLESGPELDLAVPAIERAAGLVDADGVRPVMSCVDRARAVAAICGGA